MTFIGLSECCLKGYTIPGEPRGIMEPVDKSKNRTVARYHATPKDGVIVNEKVAVVIYYDAFGFTIPNTKILADAFADQLGVHVFAPDYMRNPIPASSLDPIIEHHPGELKNRSWFSTILNYGTTIIKVLPHVYSMLDSSCVPPSIKACEELHSEGFTTLAAIGYCRGGSMVMHLLSKGDESPLVAGIICHPGPDGLGPYKTFTKPTHFHLADHDTYFGEKTIQELRDIMERKKEEEGMESEIFVHPETVHGFAARPDFGHEPSRTAFNKANDEAVSFFEKYLLGMI